MFFEHSPRRDDHGLRTRRVHRERVKTLTDGRQHPVMSRPNAIPDFAFAVVK